MTTIFGNNYSNIAAAGETPIYQRTGGSNSEGVTTTKGEIDVATAPKYDKYFLSPAIYDLTHWNTAETDNTKRKDLEINATGITHDSRSYGSSYWQPGGIFSVRINMTKHLLRAGRVNNPSSPPAHFLVSFHNNGGNTHQPDLDASIGQNEVYFSNASAQQSNHQYAPTGSTGSFIIASVSHPHDFSPFTRVCGDAFGVFQIDGKLHVGLHSWGPNFNTDCTGDIEYAVRVTELC